MSDTIASDATPHPRQGTPRRAARATSRNEDHFDSDDDLDLLHPAAATLTSASSSRPQSRGTNQKTVWNEKDQADSDSEESSLDSFDEEDGARRRSRRRRRLSSSASHILAQAPAVPDLRFDHNYRKALDQCYESFATDTARAAARAAALSSSSLSEKQDSKSRPQGQEHSISVPSVAARITVMTLRDIIIMPFVHGFFWGFGTVLLTLASQRSLFYHIHKTWTSVFGSGGGGGADEKPMVIRGEPARVRRFGGGSSLTGLGLMNAGSAAPAPGLGRPVY